MESNLFFYANFPIASVPDQNGAPFYLLRQNSHFWSLCVEMQFYAVIVFVALAGRRGLIVVPIACVIVTAARIAYGEHNSIVTVVAC